MAANKLFADRDSGHRWKLSSCIRVPQGQRTPTNLVNGAARGEKFFVDFKHGQFGRGKLPLHFSARQLN
jgi:hypothetical protein